MPFPLFILGSSSIAVFTIVCVARLPGHKRAALAVASLGAVALLLFSGLGYFQLVVDDAFINFRYSQNLADGLGPNWNAEGRVEGYTNFLWMGLLAGVAKLGIDIVVAAVVLGCLAACATGAVLFRIWRLWGEQADDTVGLQSPMLFAVVLIGLALNSGVSFWAFSGLETPLFMLLLTLGAYLHMTEHQRGRVPWSAPAFAALAMTRPEGLIAVAVTGLFKLTKLIDSKDRAGDLQSIVLWGSTFLGLYGSYFIWRYSYYGYLLPNTFYAKVGLNLASLDRGLDYLVDWGVQFHLLPMLIGAAVLATVPKLRQDVVYVLLLCGSLLATVALEGGDFMLYGRLLVPVLPLLYLTGLMGFGVLLKKLATTPVTAVAIACFGLGLGGLMLLQGSYTPNLAQERMLRENRVRLGTWLNENAPDDYALAVQAAGAISFYSEREVVDLLGLNDVVIAHTDVNDFGKGAPGHEKYNLDYVFETAKPELIYLNEGTHAPQTLASLSDQVRSEPSFAAGMNELFSDPRLSDLYEVRWVYAEGIWFNLLQLRTTLKEFEAPGLVGNQNFLQITSNSPFDGWEAWRGRLVVGQDGLTVSSDEPAYAAFKSADGSGIELKQGQEFVALVWVKADEATPEGQIEIVIREDGSRDGESLELYPITNSWQPIWVEHTITTSDVISLSVTILRLNEDGEGGAFTFRDGRLLESD